MACIYELTRVDTEITCRVMPPTRPSGKRSASECIYCPRNSEQQKPGLLGMVANYIANTAAHVAGGMEMVDEATYAARRASCDSCPNRNTSNDSCNLCGCALSATLIGDKLRRAVSECPAKRWSSIGVTP